MKAQSRPMRAGQDTTLFRLHQCVEEEAHSRAFLWLAALGVFNEGLCELLGVLNE